MSSTPPEALPLERLLSRAVLISAAALGAAVVLAWAWLFANAMPGTEAMAGMDGMEGMAGMATGPALWEPAHILAAYVMWLLMMVAMMLPSAAPMILLHARIDRGTLAGRTRDNALFALCYLAVWSAFSALAVAAQLALIEAGWLSATTLTLGNRALAAGLLLAAAVWQLTSAKAACLEQCRSPIQFVLRHWRPGPTGAVRLGLVHGLYCLGCCWSLMLLLFVAGVMNLAWIALLGAAVLIEKLAPPAWGISRWIAFILAAGAIAVLLA